jgi:hypothetical protein
MAGANMPSRRLNAALCRLTRAMLQHSREGFSLFAVVSGIDEEIYIFAGRTEALEFAEAADGSTFEMSAKEI